MKVSWSHCRCDCRNFTFVVFISLFIYMAAPSGIEHSYVAAVSKCVFFYLRIYLNNVWIFCKFFIQYKVFLLSAFVIFFILRNMRCWRNQIHWNLITSLIMQTASWFILNRFLTLGSGFKTRFQVRK